MISEYFFSGSLFAFHFNTVVCLVAWCAQSLHSFVLTCIRNTYFLYKGREINKTVCRIHTHSWLTVWSHLFYYLLSWYKWHTQCSSWFLSTSWIHANVKLSILWSHLYCILQEGNITYRWIIHNLWAMPGKIPELNNKYTWYLFYWK